MTCEMISEWALCLTRTQPLSINILCRFSKLGHHSEQHNHVQLLPIYRCVSIVVMEVQSVVFVLSVRELWVMSSRKYAMWKRCTMSTALQWKLLWEPIDWNMLQRLTHYSRVLVVVVQSEIRWSWCFIMVYIYDTWWFIAVMCMSILSLLVSVGLSNT